MAVGDVYEMVIKGVEQSQAVYSVFHFRAESGGDISNQIITDWVAGCRTAWLNQLHTGYAIASIKCQQVYPSGPIGVETTPAGTNTGNGATAPAGMTTCAVIKWTTGYIGRSRRGRTYYGPLPSNSVTNGTVAAGTVTALQSFVTAMKNGFTGAGTYVANETLVVFSRKISQQVSPAPTTAMGLSNSVSAYVLNGVVDTVARSMRRRELNVGA